MTLAVAMATCNGESFIGEQLESIARQTRRPDVLAISDAGSSDRTLELVWEFARRAPFEVSIHELGYRTPPFETFLDAIAHTMADLIAFSDQDDVWEPDKLEVCERLICRSGASLVVHALEHISLRGGVWCAVDNTRVPKRKFDVLELRPEQCFRGMSMMFNRELFVRALGMRARWEAGLDGIFARRGDTVLDYWTRGHDLLVWTAARLLGQCVFEPRSLARQRWHTMNYSACEAPERSQDAPALRQDKSYMVLAGFCEDMAEFAAGCAADGQIGAARAAIAQASYARWADLYAKRSQVHLPRSDAFFRARNFVQIASLGGYRSRGGFGGRSLIKDLLAVGDMHLD
jgi:hypothetical protein